MSPAKRAPGPARECPCATGVAAAMLRIMACALHLIFGDDEYLVASEARSLVDSLVPPDRQAFGLEIVDGHAESSDEAVAAVQHCLEALQTIGLFGGEKVTWLRGVRFFGDSQASRTQAVREAVARLTQVIRGGLVTGQTLVITASSVDKRLALYKACQEVGQVREFAIPDKAYMAERQAETRLRECLSKAGLRMAEDTRQAFLSRVGFDTRQMVNEIEKLVTYLGEEKSVEASDIEAVTCPTREALAWDLADAVGNRNAGRALTLLRRLLAQKESPIGLISVLESRIRDLRVYREALDQGWVRMSGPRVRAEWGEVPPGVDAAFAAVPGKDMRAAHPVRAGHLAAQARQFSPRELRLFEDLLIRTHLQMVSSGTPQPLLLEMLLLRMLPRRATPHGANSPAAAASTRA